MIRANFGNMYTLLIGVENIVQLLSNIRNIEWKTT